MEGMMQLKEGVSLQGLDLRMRPALIEADRIWKQHGQELVVTSGTEDIAHSAGSLHYYGLAVDCRTNYFSEGEKHTAKEELQRALGASFDVVLEATHIHVEYDGR